MNLLENIKNAPARLMDFFTSMMEMFGTSIEALQTFYDMLMEFDERVVAMIIACGESEFDVPVILAIGTFRYVVGETIFYLIYLMILFGCLWTIYKLITLLLKFNNMLIDQLSGGVSSKGQFSTLLSRIFK